ncbi:MAG: hypothetical protein RSF67_08410 [Clostridia bacterium]
MKEFNTLIENICKSNSIKYKLLSNNWIYVLEKDNIIRYIVGYKFDLNNHGIGSIIDDKYALYELLKYKNVPVTEHKLLYKDYKEKDVLNFFIKYNQDVVVKTNKGTCGTGVYHIKNKDELIKRMDNLLINNYSISLCPFYNIKCEYRVIVLDNKVMLIYGKKKPVVVGNGKSSLKELLMTFNNNYFNDLIHFNNKLYDLNYIPKNNEIIEYNWQFNLSKGSVSFVLEDELIKEKLSNIALLAASTTNATFCSVDIINTVDNLFLVLEVNSGVMMDNFLLQHKECKEQVIDIYSKAIELMFKS